MEFQPKSDSTKSLSDAERERLVLLRYWLTGWETRNPHHWQQAWRQLTRSYDPTAARQVVAALEAFVRAVAAEATGNFSFHRPCCGQLSEHERLLLDMISLKHPASLYARCAELLDPAGVGPVLSSGQRLRATLELAAFDPELGRGQALLPVEEGALRAH
jgi:hypothetical protein